MKDSSVSFPVTRDLPNKWSRFIILPTGTLPHVYIQYTHIMQIHMQYTYIPGSSTYQKAYLENPGIYTHTHYIYIYIHYNYSQVGFHPDFFSKTLPCPGKLVTCRRSWRSTCPWVRRMVRPSLSEERLRAWQILRVSLWPFWDGYIYNLWLVAPKQSRSMTSSHRYVSVTRG